jgi:hypothetical protein
MDSTLFIFLEIVSFSIFFYSLEKDNWQGLLIFLSTALFLPLSLASFDIEKFYAVYNATSGEISQYTITYYDSIYGYLNIIMALFSIAVGYIKTITFKAALNQDD